MIPLKDRDIRKRFPFVTILLITINILIFIYQLSLAEELKIFFIHFSVIPNHVYQALHSDVFKPMVFITLLTSQFLHGGWLHLGGNMLYLWVFGDNVEDKLGHIRFLVFYLLCGVTASILHIYIEPASAIPTVGASGAISGVLGAYIFMFPKSRVLTLIPIFIFIQIAELPAYVILGLWFVLQFINGLLSLGYTDAGMGGVAWWAHIGGFITGLILVMPFKKYK
jgi:membrane associated rhomboid family serine protease